ncbi:MAG: toxin of toxin-antitoxin system [Desulfobacteraceae bacterium 4572_123]|nr:MAG: toxin of toxin-antitoxin system [Desulfobacteraceae bacterium 4572_123]
MNVYEIRFTKEALKDVKKLTPRLKAKLKDILEKQVSQEPYSGKKLVGQLKAFYSIRLTFQDRIVYSIDEENRKVYVHRAKTHYGE